jgi:hypothetical protein
MANTKGMTRKKTLDERRYQEILRLDAERKLQRQRGERWGKPRLLPACWYQAQRETATIH